MALPEYKRTASKETANSFDYDVYLKYLESKKWNTLRNKRLAMDNYQCVVCGNPHNLQVHHLIYPQILGTEHISHLVTLCSGCHSAIEDRKNTARYDNRAKRWYSELQIWVRFESKDEYEHNSEKLMKCISNAYTSTNPLNIYFADTKETLYRVCWASISDCKKLLDDGFNVRLG